ncbi:MAG: hypothetical protein IPO21_14945 [Bacteroidales bacterium]|nr:hypothetical protein [Bacteroidales bacterium]
MSFAPTSVPPTVEISSPVAGSQFNTSQIVPILATASSSTGTIASVKFYAGTTLLATDNSAPFSLDWSGMQVGSYDLIAIATDNAGITASDTVSIKIIAAPITISLKKGWNFIGYPYELSADVSIALASIWDYVLVVKDMDKFYYKSQPMYLNGLTQLSWGCGYLVSVNQNCELIWNVK